MSASTNAVFWIELANYGANSVSLAGFVIRGDGEPGGYIDYVFPAGPSIPAGGFLVVSNSTLGFNPVDNDRLFLLPPTRNSRSPRSR